MNDEEQGQEVMDNNAKTNEQRLFFAQQHPTTKATLDDVSDALQPKKKPKKTKKPKKKTKEKRAASS